MRPIVKTLPENSILAKTDNPQAADFIVALFDSIGRFCSICEKPLSSSANLFHKGRGVVNSATLAKVEWAQLLLICEDCKGNMQSPFNPKRKYLWPDEYKTFDASSSTSPYVYRVRQATYEITDNQTGNVLKTETRSYVFVEANPSSTVREGAQNVIDLFQLNSAYYNNQPRTPVISIPANATALDGRMNGRYNAYLRAKRSIEKVQESVAVYQLTATLGTDIVEYLEMMLDATGYWSTWATAFWESFANQKTLTDLLPNLSTYWQDEMGNDLKRKWDTLDRDIETPS
jgi:hypothetical protein